MRKQTATNTLRYTFALALVLLFGVGCLSPDPGQDTPVVPTAEATDTLAPTAVPATPTEAPTVTPTTPPSATPTIAPSTTPEPTATPQSEVTYRVVYVAPDDELNVRQEEGASAQVTGALSPAADAVSVVGQGRPSNGNVWLPIETGEISGWVNSLYLTEAVPPERFCQAEAPREVLDRLQEALAAQDTDRLLQILNANRGLRIRTHWWNPEVWLRNQALAPLFTGQTSYEWGIEDGSGRPITGSFAETILPLLQEDLLGAEEMACNEIIHGPTAGLVTLPDEYEGINYYSLHRPPAPDAIEFDWGTWVVGIEQWQGEYAIAFLVHYAYEI